MKNITAILAILMVIFAGLACSGDDTEKANALVAEANKAIVEGNNNFDQVKTKGGEFDQKVKEAQTEDEKNSAVDFGNKELMPLYNSMSDNFQKAGDKFDEASKLKLNEKFKEYLAAKAAEFKKRAELANAFKAIPKILSDSKNKNDYKEESAKIVEKVQKLSKEAQELADKATKIADDNPTVIKKI